MRRFFRNRSIRTVIILAFMSVTILAMVFCEILLMKKFTSIVEISDYTHTRQIIQQMNMNLDHYLRNMLETSYHVANLISEAEDVEEEELQKMVEVIYKSRKDIVTIALVNQEGEVVFGSAEVKFQEPAFFRSQSWFQKSIDEPGNFYFSAPYAGDQQKERKVITLSRGVTYRDSGEKIKGTLLVDLNFRTIDDLFATLKLGQRGYGYLIDHEGQILYHPQQRAMDAGEKVENTDPIMEQVFGSYYDEEKGQPRLITIETVNYCRWRLVGVAYLDDIEKIKRNILVYMFIILFLGTGVILLLSSLISARIVKPIRELEKKMGYVERGNFDVTIPIQGEREVARLATAFNLMVCRIKNLMKDIVDKQEKLRMSEFNALQAQINPHFLYNTLDAIIWMAEKKKTEGVITMTTSLSRLFRISISRGKNMIPLQQEIEHVKHYLVIQFMRYEDKFTYDFSIDPQCENVIVPKLILQPIVENAIYHGIRQMVDAGHIHIKVWEDEGNVLILVEDNGQGMSQERVQTLLDKSRDIEEERKGHGVGLLNVHERIGLIYGKGYGLDIESEREVGTKILLTLSREGL